MIRRVITTIAAGVALLSGINAYAITENSTATLTCDSSPELSLTLVSFNLQVNAPPAASSSGAAKTVLSPLTVIFAANKSFAQLLTELETGEHFSGCTLTQVLTTAGSKTNSVFKWNLKQVEFVSLSAVGTNSSNTSSAGADTPVGLMQVNFEFASVEFTARVSGT